MRWLILILLALIASPTMAGEVRGGRHEGFVRFVFTIPFGAEWRLGRVPTGYALWVAGSDAWDMGPALAKAGYGRVGGYEQTGDVLNLVVNCPCHAEVIPWRPDRIVLDIAEGPAPASSPFEDAFAAPSDVLAQPPTANSLPALAETVPSQIRLIADADLGAANTAAGVGYDAVLARNLAQAISDGLLARAGGNGSADVQFSGGSARHEMPGLAARDAFADPTSQESSLTADGSLCLEDNAFALPAWEDAEHYVRLLAEAGAQIFDARDRVSDQALEVYATALVAGGFGREAIAALGQSDVTNSVRMRIIHLAQLVDGDETGAPILADQAGCTGAVAIWAYLDGAGPLVPSVMNAILMQIRALPPPLQGAIGPPLARRLLTDHEPEAAEAVLGLAATSSFAARADLALVEIALAAEKGDTPTLQDKMAAVLGDPMLSPETLTALLTLVGQGTIEGSDDLLDSADFMRPQFRQSKSGPDLDRARMAASLEMGEFGRARVILDEGARPPDVEHALQTMFFDAVTTSPNDGVFLRYAFEDLPALAPETVRAISIRLAALGFAARAQMIAPAPTIEMQLTVGHDQQAVTVPELSSRMAAAPPQTLAAYGQLLEAASATRDRIDALLALPSDVAR